MTLTINRKDEISEMELLSIKKRFNEKTKTRAIHASVKFVVYDVPKLEAKIEKQQKLIQEISQRYNELIKTVKKKHVLDSELENLLFSEISFNVA